MVLSFIVLSYRDVVWEIQIFFVLLFCVTSPIYLDCFG